MFYFDLTAIVQDGKVFMISYPELHEFTKLCFVDDLYTGAHTLLRYKNTLNIGLDFNLVFYFSYRPTHCVALL